MRTAPRRSPPRRSRPTCSRVRPSRRRRSRARRSRRRRSRARRSRPRRSPRRRSPARPSRPGVLGPGLLRPGVLGQAFSAQAFSAQAFSAQAFSSAQVQSVIAVSALDGTNTEHVSRTPGTTPAASTCASAGANGAFDLNDPFTIQVTQSGTSCAGVHTIGSAPALTTEPAIKTVILTDSSQIAGTTTEKADARHEARRVQGPARSRRQGHRRRRDHAHPAAECPGGRATRLPVREEPRRERPQGHRRLVPDDRQPGPQVRRPDRRRPRDPVLPVPGRGAARARVQLQHRPRGQPAPRRRASGSTTSSARMHTAARLPSTMARTTFPVPGPGRRPTGRDGGRGDDDAQRLSRHRERRRVAGQLAGHRLRLPLAMRRPPS